MSTKPLIAVIGSLNIDYVTTTPRCPSAGETLNATSLKIFPGGKGANQAVGCGKASFVAPGQQDVAVEMIGAVGADDVSVETLLFPTLEESGVGVGGVAAMNEVQTGTASIVVETAAGKGENRIMFVAGANHAGMSDVDEILGRVAKIAGNSDPDVVVMQGEIPRSSVIGLLQRFNSNKKTKVVFNPAPVFEDGIPLSAFKNLEVLVVNETETILLGKALANDGFNRQSEEALRKEETLEAFAKQFHDLAAIKVVLITLGAKGVYYSAASNGKKGLVPGLRVDKVVDTTAAGDTFVGYFAAALARHATSAQPGSTFDIAKAVASANSAAAKCVQRAGAMQSIPFGYE